jgi:S-layer protein (TIGR01567 family)
MVGLRRIFIGLMVIALILVVVQAEPPSVEFVNPSNTDPITENITLEASATDDYSISKVEFFHNDDGSEGWMLIGTNTTADCGNNYCFEWDITEVDYGNEYVLRVIATDNSSEESNPYDIGGSSGYITIKSQLPTVEVTYPDDYEELNDIVEITATANDITGVDNVAFECSRDNGDNWDNLGQGELDTGSLYYYYSWNTTKYPDGSKYLIRATVTDNVGLTASDTSDNTFDVSNTLNDLPTVNVTSPNGGEIIKITPITITADASYSGGTIDKVDFYYTDDDGDSEKFIDSDESEPYEVDWDLKNVPNGDSYKIIAKATDNRDETASNMSDSTFSIDINHPPELTDNKSNVTGGPSPLAVNFTVIYTDMDNDEGTVTLHIDGDDPHTMEAIDTNNPSQGITYEYITTFSPTSKKVYTFHFEVLGTTVKTKDQTITVQSKTYESGNRIWDEEEEMSYTYTWTPQSFSGFYYNLDTNEGKETLTIEDIKRSIDSDDIIYVTEPIVKEFECNSFGKYSVIGFMAERYFAGYEEKSIMNDGFSLLDEEILSRVLIDDDESQMIKSGIPLVLEEGYEFRVTEYAASGDDVMVALFKDGESIYETILSEGSTFTYKKDLGSAEDIPIIALHVDTVFRGMETSTISIDGIFQISDDYINVEDGDKFGLMEIDRVDSGQITMLNSNTVSLKKGKTFNLMGKINIEVGNCDKIRFALAVDTSEPGTYELRGTVTQDEKYTWTPLNFEGLLYDMDSGESTETLKLDNREGRTIKSGNLDYITSTINMSFEYSGWDDYESIGFMGEKYFAGYKDNSIEKKGVSLMNKGYLGKILIDEDEKHTLYVGNSLPLAEGYSFRIDEISQDGDSIMVALLRDGEEIKSDIINDDSTYTHTKEVDDEDIPVIAIHIDNIFRGMETNSIFVNGIFQISEDFKKVEEGNSYGKMEIYDVSKDEIVMSNDGSIGLGKGDTISIMGDIKIKVADDDNAVRFYPFQEIKVEALESLEIDFPDNIYSNQEFTIKVTSDGDEVEGAYVSFGDIEIGATDSNGELVYTPTETGSFNITASKSGYNSDSSEIEVIFLPEALDITFPSVIDKNELLTILVTAEGSPLSGASVMFGNIDLGTTPSSGNISYTPDEIGTFTISASKSGYQDVSKDIDISDPSAKLVFANLTIDPEEIDPGQTVTISVETTNFGTLREAETVILYLNEEEESTRDVTLGPGEISTITFSVNKSKSGTYDVEIGGLEGSFKVTGGSSISIIAMILLGIIGLFSAGAIIYSVSKGDLTFDSMTEKASEIEVKIKRLIEK